MSSASLPPPTGHGLGPHVVGKRVVVRRLLRGQTGPSGGPAMTDLLGICVSWGADACVIQPDRGPSVQIMLSDIVSGKPVPPRPSTRLRIDPYDAQVRAGRLFPDLRTDPLGGWLLRHSTGSNARRANSALAFRPSERNDDLAAVSAAYDRPIAAVLPDSPEEQRLRAAGWTAEELIGTPVDTSFRLTGVAAAQRATGRSTEPGELRFESLGEGVVRVAVTEGGLDVASGISAYDDDWVGFRAVEVLPPHRGRGLGRTVMFALLEWGAEQGARTAYLQVLGDNRAAIALYDSLGFVEHHSYRYLAQKN